MDITTLTSLINTFRAETKQDSITPDSLGQLLQKIVNLLENAAEATTVQQLEDLEASHTTRILACQIAAYDAFHRAIPHLDVILTPNGFGIVSNSNIAPASKERVERLMASLLEHRSSRIKRIVWAIGSDYLLNLSPTNPSPTSPDIKSKCLKSGGVGARS